MVLEKLCKNFIVEDNDWFILPWRYLSFLSLYLLENKFVPWLQSRTQFQSAIQAHKTISQPFLLYAGLFGVLIYSLLKTGDARPLPYVILLNPLDISLFSVLLWQWKSLQNFADHFDSIKYQWHLRSTVIIAFIAFNSFLIRAVAHIFKLPFTWHLWSTPSIQMTLSIAWTCLALMLMTSRIIL